MLHFVCSDCSDSGWSIPQAAWVAICYWIFAGSVLGYLLNTWGNKHVNASLLGVYAVVQPLVTVAVAQIVIASSQPPHWGLEGVRVSDLGAIGIVFGMMIVSFDNAKDEAKAESQRNDSLDKDMEGACEDTDSTSAPLLSNEQLEEAECE